MCIFVLVTEFSQIILCGQTPTGVCKCPNLTFNELITHSHGLPNCLLCGLLGCFMKMSFCNFQRMITRRCSPGPRPASSPAGMTNLNVALTAISNTRLLKVDPRALAWTPPKVPTQHTLFFFLANNICRGQIPTLKSRFCLNRASEYKIRLDTTRLGPRGRRSPRTPCWARLGFWLAMP